jgi:cation diffusion facilitator CzcD-associated flavoprotein CzcO
MRQLSVSLPGGTHHLSEASATSEGDIYHTAVWPQYGVNTKGKKAAQIGTGASRIQVIQEIGPKVGQLTIYQRTPNYCLPMNQRTPDEKGEEKSKAGGKYEESFQKTC